MERINKDTNPIYYKNAEEIDKLPSVLVEELRMDMVKIRGKLFDIKHSYGFDDRIEHLEGGLTCMIVAMHYAMTEFEEIEKNQRTK